MKDPQYTHLMAFTALGLEWSLNANDTGAVFFALYRGGDEIHRHNLMGDARTVARVGETLVTFARWCGVET